MLLGWFWIGWLLWGFIVLVSRAASCAILPCSMPIALCHDLVDGCSGRACCYSYYLRAGTVPILAIA